MSHTERTGVQSPPEHIVVTCPHCGHANLFRQPHPYHAGYAGQGFLYSETGHCTLTWNAYDRDFTAIVGPKQPWTLTPTDRTALEERLVPAPDGTRWLFDNPARCLRCGREISGSMSDTIYYLRYDCAVDRDLRAGWGSGLKDVLYKVGNAVPWTSRDVWLGVVAAVVIMGLAYAVAYLILGLLQPNADWWVAVFPTLVELLILVPVWWFAVHKRGASLASLGFRRFKPSWVAVGIGLLFSYYIFSIFYSYVLAQSGQQIQRDMTPILRELASPWPLFFSVVYVAPVVEEVFFRGFVFAGLRSRMDWWWAALISSALFAAAHLDLWFFLPAGLLGFLFAFLYHKTDSVWPGLILHFLVNLFAMSITLLLM